MHSQHWFSFSFLTSFFFSSNILSSLVCLNRTKSIHVFKCFDIKMIRCSVKIKYSWEKGRFCERWFQRLSLYTADVCVCVCMLYTHLYYMCIIISSFARFYFTQWILMPQESKCGKINDSNRIKPRIFVTIFDFDFNAKCYATQFGTWWKSEKMLCEKERGKKAKGKSRKYWEKKDVEITGNTEWIDEQFELMWIVCNKHRDHLHSLAFHSLIKFPN